MCRLLGYLGDRLPLTELLIAPHHSLLEQSYQPQEMTAGLLNADGFGIGCYHPHREISPLIYRSILPIWNDVNLSSICRFISSDCVVANVRSATPGLAVDVSNCQPFGWKNWLFVHNGFIQNFQQTLDRPLTNLLHDEFYQLIRGTTDSEHIFALLMQYIQKSEGDILSALQSVLSTISTLSREFQISSSLNLIFTNGIDIYACRYSTHPPAPSLYYLQHDRAIYIASEPMAFRHLPPKAWQSFPENSFLSHSTTLATTLATTVEVGQFAQAIA